AMAALACFERVLAEQGPSALRPVRIVSFERDLNPLKLAAKNASHFPHLRHGAPHGILDAGRWMHASELLRWELVYGDFLEHFRAAPKPDLIFYDPFSAKTDTGLWSPEVFAEIFVYAQGKPAELYTYSASTAVRVALLTAGFFVAEGVGTGPKSTTTIAYTRADGAGNHPRSPQLLGQPWLARWRRSHTRFPSTLSPEAQGRGAVLIET